MPIDRMRHRAPGPVRVLLDRWLAHLITSVVVGLALLLSVPALGGEVCDYAGQTDYSGVAHVRAEISPAQGETQVRVALRFTAKMLIILRVEYLAEEISFWRNGELARLAVNTRYLVDNRIIRQQWDYFDRGSDGLTAYRVQGKRGDDFRKKYPAFFHYWSPSTFGENWLKDYQSAVPERRPDLDLRNQALPAGLRSPLAFAFYWIRSLRPASQTVPLFLPGNKHQSRIDLSIPAPASEPQSGERRWHIPIHLDAPKTLADSEAWISATQQLQQIAFSGRNDSGTGSGLIREVKCEQQ
jgi:hypothetical protein